MRQLIRPGTPLAAIGRRLASFPGAAFGGRPIAGEADTAASQSYGATATPGVSNTKGVWAQVVAATTFEAHGLVVILDTPTHLAAANNSWLLDIGVGAAASEVVVIPDVPIGANEILTTIPPRPLIGIFPIRIPDASRVAIRVQANAAVPSPTTVGVRIMFMRETQLGVTPQQKLISIGVQTANGRGVDFAVLGAANTKGAWTEITASCPQPLSGLVVHVQGGTDTAFTSGTGLLDIGIGASGAEQVVLGDLMFRTGANEAITMMYPGVYPVSIPKGARISARYQASTTANDLDLALTGIPA